MSGNHKKTHNKADHDEENLSDSLLGVLRSSRGNRKEAEKLLKKQLEEKMQQRINKVIKELNIAQLIQKHATAGEKSFSVNITKYVNDIQPRVANKTFGLNFAKTKKDFVHALRKVLSVEELDCSIAAVCNVCKKPTLHFDEDNTRSEGVIFLPCYRPRSYKNTCGLQYESGQSIKLTVQWN